MTGSTDTLDLLRRGLLVLLAIGCVGALGELVLLGHFEEVAQYPPLALLSGTLIAILAHWLAGGRRSLRALQVLGILMVLGGTIGVTLHFLGNMEVERELNPDVEGWAFWSEVLRGSAPALAPGTLVQFGLMALLYAYRHPALAKRAA